MSTPPRSITKSQCELSTADLTPQKLELRQTNVAAAAPPLPPAVGTRVNMLPPAASPPPYAKEAPPPTPPTWASYSPTTPPRGLARLAPPEASATPVRRLLGRELGAAPELGAAASSAEASAAFSAAARCEVAAARSGGVAAVRITGSVEEQRPESSSNGHARDNGLRASLESLEHFGDGSSDALAAACDALGAVDDWVRRGDAAPMWAAKGDPRARDRLLVEREVMLRQVRALLAVNTRLSADLARAREAASPARSLAFDGGDDAAASDGGGAEAALLRDRVQALEDALADTTARLSAAADVATAARNDMDLAQKRLRRAEARSATLEKRLDAESDLDWASQLIRHERDAEGKRADAAEEEVKALKGQLARANAEIAALKGLPLKGHEVTALKTPPQSPSKTQQEASSPYHWRSRRDTAEAACQATEPEAARDANKARGAAALLRATEGPARRAADARVRRGVTALAANVRRRRAVRLCAAKLMRATAERCWPARIERHRRVLTGRRTHRRADGKRRALAVMAAARARQGVLENLARAVGRAGAGSYERRLRRGMFRIFRGALLSSAAARDTASDRAAQARTHHHRFTLVLLRSGARVARRSALKLGLRAFRRRDDYATRAHFLSSMIVAGARSAEWRGVRAAFGWWTGATRLAARQDASSSLLGPPPSPVVMPPGRRAPPRESTAAQRHRAVLRNLDVARARTAEARDALAGLLPP